MNEYGGVNEWLHSILKSAPDGGDSCGLAGLPSSASPGGRQGKAHQIWLVPGQQNTQGRPKPAPLPCGEEGS